jgi:hypothetical protein
MVGTIAPGVTTGTYVYTIPSVNATSTIVLTATKDPTLYKVSGKVTGVNISGLTMTLQSTGKSVLTDANGNYTFYGVPTGNDVITPSGPVKFSPTYRNVGINNADSVGNDFTTTLVEGSPEMAISIIYRDYGDGRVTTVIAQSMTPLVLGDVLTFWGKKPGESISTQWHDPVIIDSNLAGRYMTFYFYDGKDFFDVLPDGTKKFWLPGSAVFEVRDKKLSGLTTFVLAEVPVPGDPNRTFGPLVRVDVSPDGKSAQLFGEGLAGTVVELYQMVGTAFRSVTLVPQNGIITIPSDFYGLKSPVTVVFRKQDGSYLCSTAYPDIPKQQ